MAQHSVNEESLCSPGTVFLWMFWPSFNSVLVDDNPPGRKLGAVLNTYLALAASAVTAAAVSVLSSPKGKLNLVQLEAHCIESPLHCMYIYIFFLKTKTNYKPLLF